MTNRSVFSKYGEYLALGAEIAGAVLVPILLGYWLDSYFNISPWLTLAGCLVGVMNIILLFIRLARKINEK